MAQKEPDEKDNGRGAPDSRSERYRIDATKLNKQVPAERVHNWDEVFLGFTPEVAIIEASRCLECGPLPPCQVACPVDNDIANAMYLIAEGRFAEAGIKFYETSNMPEICGRICPQEVLCEGSCVLVGHEEPVRIGKLEAFCTDFLRNHDGGYRPPVAEKNGFQVAIIGGGPAGLTVAEELAKLGHTPTVIDMWPRPGGLLIYGIPNFKLNKEIVEDLTRRLEHHGVVFRPGVKVGKEHGVEELLAEGYDAVFLGHGATAGNQMRTPGDDLINVYQATEFLVRGNVPLEELPEDFRSRPRVGNRIAVIGGGDTSMDCVRTAKRLAPGGKVICVYRRTENEMPGRVEERQHAKEEGVQFDFLTLPTRFFGNDKGEVEAIECIRMKLGEPDAKGRRRPVEIPGTEFRMEADTVVLALGYNMDQEIAETTPDLKVAKWGTIWVESEDTGRTSHEDVWAGGDSVRGADLVVTAVAAARLAAQDIHRSLLNKQPKKVLPI